MSKGRRPVVSDSELVEAISTHDDRAVTASEVAEQVDIKRPGTLQRLKQLYEEGVVERKRVGSRAVIWWLAD